MPFSALVAVLTGALIHASWNLLIKKAPDKLAMSLSVAIGAGGIALCILPFLPQPAAASWPYLAASVILQSVYYLLIARAYRLADMSLAYPLMRGVAPLIVALVSLPLAGEALSGGEWAGVGLISSGILALALFSGNGIRRLAGPLTAATNATVIAAYTLVDGLGARASGAPAAYTLWLAVGTGLVTFALVRIGRQRPRLGAQTLGLGIVGGAATTLSYGIALWAMTAAPLALVAALRETSILFALLLSGLVLGERVGAGRLAAVLLMAAGIVALKAA